MAVAVTLPEIEGVVIAPFKGTDAPLTLFTCAIGVSTRIMSLRYRVDADGTPGPTRAWVFEYLDKARNLLFQLVPPSGPPTSANPSPFGLVSFGLGIPLYQQENFGTLGSEQYAENGGLPDLWLTEGCSLRFNSIPTGDALDRFSGVYVLVQQVLASDASAFLEVPVYLVPEPVGAA